MQDKKDEQITTLLYYENKELLRKMVFLSKSNIKTVVNNAIAEYCTKNIKKIQ